MEKRILGRTGIEVSVVGIGGEGFENATMEECQAIVDEAITNGVNYFDVYNSNPTMRSNLGNALSKYERQQFVIEGHLCSMWDNGQYRRTRNMQEIVPAFEDLLARLQVAYIDVGMIHYVDEMTDFEKIFHGEIIDYAKKLLKEGKVKHLGLSTHNPKIALAAVETGLIDVILFSINPGYDMLEASEDVDILFEQSTFENRTYEGINKERAALYQLCENKGVALTVMKALGAGSLLDAKMSPFQEAMTPVQCIHYCLNRPAVASVFVGAANLDELKECLAYATATDEMKDYSAILAKAPKTNFQGQCMYCGHCAPCTKKIDIALVNKYYDLATIQKVVPETVIDHYELLAHHASECIACGACMKNCPFGVDIIERMKKATEFFGK